MSRARLWTIFILVLIVGGCSSNKNARISASIQQILTAAPASSVAENVHTAVDRFYKERGYTPAWVEDGDLAKVADALRVLRSADDHGLVASGYREEAVAGAMANEDTLEESIERLAQLDVDITTGLLALGHDVAVGRKDPKTIDPRWKRERVAPDLAALLAQAAAGDLNTWLPSVQPRHPEYATLQKELAAIRARRSDSDADRVHLLAMNLERWRWLPDDLGSPHILVNVPAFHLEVRENGRAVLDMKVVVGEAEAARRTPLFSGEMETVVFSPYWNVPDSIVEGETAPAFARDPSFLDRNNIEILRQSKRGTELVDPDSVDWDDENELKQLLFRQRPGPGNALGHVKFLFPNPYHVYLHDTPADALFARRGRALSHGCVRLEQPEALAQYVLRDSSEWDADRIHTAMYSGDEKHVALERKIPVHIVYFTAWPKPGGGFETLPDVYGHDAKQGRN